MKLFLLFTFLISSPTWAISKLKIKDVSLKNMSNGTQFEIVFHGRLRKTPELIVKNRTVQVEIPNSFVWPKQEKKVSLINKFDTTLMAYQFDKENVRVRAILPKSLKGREASVNLTIRDNKILLNLPKFAAAVKRKPVVAQKRKKTDYLPSALREKEANPSIPAKLKKKSSDKYDEVFLNQLLADKKVKGDAHKKVEPLAGLRNDKVKSVQSSLLKNDDKKFSLSSYALKFVGFLGVILIFIWGVFQLFKKGMLKKGKLGFLNSTKVIEVLNTTYVAPKKALLLVKVHKQIFLMSSTDKGIEFLSEVNDLPGVMKDGELDVSGSNFDTNLGNADGKSKEFKLKEHPLEASALESFLKPEEQTETVKFSDQIKDKVKNLKSFQ